MLNLLIAVLGLSGLVFVLIDLVRYDIETMPMLLNWLVLLAILPFVVATNAVLFVWYLVSLNSFSEAYDETFRGMWSDITDALSAGW